MNLMTFLLLLSAAELTTAPLSRLVARLGLKDKAESSSASVMSTKKLQKDLRQLQKLKKQGEFSVGIRGNSIYQWEVKLTEKALDKDSELASDLLKLAKEYKQDHLLFHFDFSDRFPIEPPIVTLVSPVVRGEFILANGGICMQMLTSHWNSEFTVEAIIRELTIQLVAGDSRIDFTQPIKCCGRLQKDFQLMKENEKEDEFSIGLRGDENKFNQWVVKIKQKILDQDCKLAKDLSKLAKDYHRDHLLFYFEFTERFPMEPPFVRLVSPMVTGGRMLDHGAISMELLTSQGWKPNYTVDAIVRELIGQLSHFHGQINFGRLGEEYTESEAREAFKEVERYYAN